jgi:fatty-acyl-CoA synthase
MSSLTDQMYANAATSRRGMITGTFEDPIRRSWGEVHDEARRMAGALADVGVVPGTSVAVLAGDPADVAPLAAAVWQRAP